MADALDELGLECAALKIQKGLQYPSALGGMLAMKNGIGFTMNIC
jgi:hypothetical protein